ncbi:alpha-keto acid decarboxylase family protein [Hymenobacter aquaticus]|uniref:Alpha-keto acid decarboxylase family protein n=1 Tax=Hymenobacter aquaticus TaxID=1867101 RepID=A0A4Z0PYD7_9BACT|nr:thiamine pyrophosphate-binding protein [Hymenobacter aquaticus]TGE22266.1 alpha-keto acid decarboxylase family protein [Hymenobacter aquaticus]
MTVSDYILARLKQLGLEHIFAVPGDYASPFLSVLDQTPGITRVPNINELGSGYAADGYARFRGIGAACVQYGVGTFSLLNCTAGSYVERLPVVVISASPKTSDRKLERQQGILFHHSTGNLRADQQVFQRVTVASEIVNDAGAAPAQIDRALTAMLTHQRPIYIEVLNDIWAKECAEPVGMLAAQPRPSDPAALEAAVAAAWTRIQEARLPVLWLGVEIQRYGLQELAQELVELSGLPFTTTSVGKTVLDESQPQFIGTYAGPASPALTRAVMAATDCPIALGTIITDDYLDIMKASFGAMLEVTDEEVRIGYQHYPYVTLPDFLDALLTRFRAAGARPAYELPAVPADPTPALTGPLTYNTFYGALTGFLHDQQLTHDTVLVLGESTSLYVFGNLMGLPRNSFVAQAAWGSLGHETGCALGVALGSGKQPVVVAGDGGFMMVCQELSSLVRAKSNAVVFVMSNQGYAIEQAFVDINAFQPGQEFAEFDLLPSWDYAALAQAFGVRGYRAETVEELQQHLPEIMATTGQPCLVEIVIPKHDLAPQLARLAGAPPATESRQQHRLALAASRPPSS